MELGLNIGILYRMPFLKNKIHVNKTKKNARPILFLRPISDAIKIHSIYSHMRFNLLFDCFVINHLNKIFKNNGKVTDFVREERRRRGLEETNTTVESLVYGTNKMNTTFQLMIKKYDKNFIHLTIHLAPEYLKVGKKDSGMVHIVKDIYAPIISGKKDYLLHSIYTIEKVLGKSRSLHFSIQRRYSTPYNHDIINHYDDEVKKEMNVITAILNQLFDEEDKEHYVGQPTQISIENNTNNILRNMNTRTTYIKRKNIGTYITNI